MLQAVLTVKGFGDGHVDNLRVVKAKFERRKVKTAGFQIEIFDVVGGSMPENKAVFPLQERADSGINLGEGRIVFKIRIVVARRRTCNCAC